MDPNQKMTRAHQPPPPTWIYTFFLPFTVIVVMQVSAGIRVGSCLQAEHHKSLFSIVHQVPDGHVGVYWRGGALLKTITEPGFRIKIPLITHYEPVLVAPQRGMVTDIACGTKGGVMIKFEEIEVVYRIRKEYVYETLLNYGALYAKRWIDDRIHHQINQFCSSHSLQEVYIDRFDQIVENVKDALQSDFALDVLGIEITNVRVTKPTIPDNIRRNYEQMEEERTKALIAIERLKVAEMEAETSKKIAISEAEKNANVSKILMEQLLEKEGSRRQQEIEIRMFLENEKSKADADFYRATKEAEANKLKLTPEFLEFKLIEAISENGNRAFEDKVVLSSLLLVLLLLSKYCIAWCKAFLERHLQNGRLMLGLQPFP